MLAGAYVGFGGMLALSIGQNCPGLAESNPGLQKMVYGAFGLPVGLLMVRGFSMLHPTSIAVLAQTDWYGRHVYAVAYKIPQTWSRTQLPAECRHCITSLACHRQKCMAGIEISCSAAPDTCSKSLIVAWSCWPPAGSFQGVLELQQSWLPTGSASATVTGECFLCGAQHVWEVLGTAWSL